MVTLTPAASARIKELIAEKQDPEIGLRLYAMPSGWSGVSLGMALDEPSEADEVLTIDDVKVIVDALSAHYVEGATVDYRKTMFGMQFGISGGRVGSSCWRKAAAKWPND